MATDWLTLSAQNVEFLRGLARACAGALVFALPMLMTMEMWWLGIHTDSLKLALLLLLSVPLLAGLSRYSGFKPTSSLRDDIVDAFVALAVGAFIAAAVLSVMTIIQPGMSADEVIGKVAIQIGPASIGAMLARSQLAEDEGDEGKEDLDRVSYSGELFLMAIGALFLSLNLAPTEEMVQIAYKASVWHELTLVILSLVLMHAFVYRLGFRGQESGLEQAAFWSLFFRFTVAGYAIVLVIALYILWTFGRLAGLALDETISAAVVVGFPGAIGAAAARLIL